MTHSIELLTVRVLGLTFNILYIMNVSVLFQLQMAMLCRAISRMKALLSNLNRRFPVAWLWELAVATASVVGVRLSGRRRNTPVITDYTPVILGTTSVYLADVM